MSCRTCNARYERYFVIHFEALTWLTWNARSKVSRFALIFNPRLVLLLINVTIQGVLLQGVEP